MLLTDFAPPGARSAKVNVEGAAIGQALLLPLLLQDLEEMAGAVDLVLVFAGRSGFTLRPATPLGSFMLRETPGLRLI